MCLQVVSEAVKKAAAAQDGMSLVEVGPRLCLQPIKIFAGAFGGPVLYENPAYVSPNKVWCLSCTVGSLLHELDPLHSLGGCRWRLPIHSSLQSSQLSMQNTGQCYGVLPHHADAGVQIRAAVKRQNAGKYATKVKARSKRKQHVAAHPAPRDELAGVFRNT